MTPLQVVSQTAVEKAIINIYYTHTGFISGVSDSIQCLDNFLGISLTGRTNVYPAYAEATAALENPGSQVILPLRAGHN